MKNWKRGFILAGLIVLLLVLMFLVEVLFVGLERMIPPTNEPPAISGQR